MGIPDKRRVDMMNADFFSENDENMKIYVPGSFAASCSGGQPMRPEGDEVRIYCAKPNSAGSATALSSEPSYHTEYYKEKYIDDNYARSRSCVENEGNEHSQQKADY